MNVAGRISWWRKNGLPTGGVLADVGAGGGEFAAAFAGYFDQVYAVDCNDSVQRSATPDNVTWLNVELPSAAVPDGLADFLFVNNVLEHVPPWRLGMFLDCCQRVLKPGGGAWFSWASLYSNVGSHTGNRLSGWQHLFCWPTPELWCSFLKDSFGVEYAETWLDHEWRPGLKRNEWLYRFERHASLACVADLIAQRFQVVKHNMVCEHERLLSEHPRRLGLLEIAPSYFDLVCTSDTWLARKPQ